MIVAFFLLGIFSTVYSQDCGLPSVYTSRVIGGSTAKHGAFPWQVGLQEHGRTVCGGSIISPYWVLTASHCIVDARSGRLKSLRAMTVKVGDHDRMRPDNSEQTYYISRLISHPSFSFRSFISDVALIQLARPIRFNSYVKPVCLPSSPARPGENCIISGWGRMYRRSRDMARVLQYASMPVVNERTCSYYMRSVGPFPIGRYSLCSGRGDARTSGCQGDSGGPFVCRRNGRWEVHGAVSWGSKNCSERRNQYTVYANIYNLKSWIQQYVRV